MYNEKIERKWQKKWEAKKIFEANPEKRKKFFITFPYPYVNGAPHIGAAFSAFRCDVLARFKRMQGFNVLYPQGFHATGEPIVGAIERLKKKDKIQAETFKIYGATDKDIENFIKNGPEFVAKFWMKKWISHMKKSGFSVDWRRSFITTTMTPTYSRFVEWQYNTLKKKGYVTQGTHPVIWCPKCESPTGDHDRLEGEGESPTEYILIKFSFDEYILPAGTLRPETAYGVTNIWVNPETEYIIAEVDGEKWIVSKPCVEKLTDQLKNVKIIGHIKGSEMLGKKCRNPVNNTELFILPSEFVNPGSATGIVMSVPSHAPYDWIAIKELIDKDELQQYGVTKNDIEPIPVIKIPGFGENPAIEVCNQLKIMTLKQVKELEEATNIVYKKEFHLGVLNERCGEYAGMRVSECKDKLSSDYLKMGISAVMWDCARVICRCTTKCHVKILEKQWFLKFSDPEWKDRVRKCLSKMIIYPEVARTNFLNTLEWLNDKACTRKTGLGTPLPWDRSWIVETLSDSTIYMAYYTIARIINEKKIQAKKLTDSVFDYIFLGKGSLKAVSRGSDLSEKIIEEMKREFDYFYPVDMRTSGKDLIQNHLSFFLFHHVAIFPGNKWPKGIAVNGYVSVGREKMSKSKGNIIPLIDLIDQFGSDLVRINIVTSNEGLDDADWRTENINPYRSKFDFLYETVKSLKKAKVKKTRGIDLYLQSHIARNIKSSKESYETTKFRTASQYALFNNINSLRWYLKRVNGINNSNRRILYNAMADITKLISPLAPHFCEELWHMLGKRSFVSMEKWPVADNSLINEEVEQQEDFIKQVISDITEIEKIAKIKPKRISVFIADGWKFRIYEKVLKNKEREINDITKEIMRSDMRKYGKATVLFIQTIYKKINELQPVIERKEQFKILEEAKKFLEKETKCKVEILDATKNENPKAKQATPMKPALYLE